MPVGKLSQACRYHACRKIVSSLSALWATRAAQHLLLPAQARRWQSRSRRDHGQNGAASNKSQGLGHQDELGEINAAILVRIILVEELSQVLDESDALAL